MSGLVIATWDLVPARPLDALVLPDGCRDLIFRQGLGERPEWFVSDLADRPYGVAVAAGTIMRGFRLRPGVQVDDAALVAAVQGRDWCEAEVLAQISEHGALSLEVEEALACLASGVTSVGAAAALLGIGVRSLQRLLLGATGQTPVAWLQLARARQAARDATKVGSLAELADMYGYVDQSHMTRAFRRWFGVTPQRLRRDAGMTRILAEAGYG